MNLAGLREAVRLRTGTSTDDGSLTPSALDSLINEANLAIGAERDWPYRRAMVTFPMVAGQGDYAATAFAPALDWLRTLSLRVSDDRPMTARTPDDLDEKWPSANVHGRPTAYAVDGVVIRIRPVPDGVYNIVHRYVVLEPPLVNDLDVPLMPSMFHPILAEHAAYLAMRRRGDDQRAGFAKVEADEWRRRMVDDARRGKQPTSVRVRYGSAF